jgi:hypothetical protein
VPIDSPGLGSLTEAVGVGRASEDGDVDAVNAILATGRCANLTVGETTVPIEQLTLWLILSRKGLVGCHVGNGPLLSLALHRSMGFEVLGSVLKYGDRGG